MGGVLAMFPFTRGRLQQSGLTRPQLQDSARGFTCCFVYCVCFVSHTSMATSARPCAKLFIRMSLKKQIWKGASSSMQAGCLVTFLGCFVRGERSGIRFLKPISLPILLQKKHLPLNLFAGMMKQITLEKS